MTDQIITIIIVASTAGGAVLTTILKGIFDSNRKKTIEQKNELNELKEEIKLIKDQVNSIEKELEEWKEKYYTLLQQYVNLRQKYKILMSILEKNGVTEKFISEIDSQEFVEEDH